MDILDTSGDMQFPAMRRLSIATAHAFMLVYATTSAPSFQCVKQCFEEIREQRADFQVGRIMHAPCMQLVSRGPKLDSVREKQEGAHTACGPQAINSRVEPQRAEKYLCLVWEFRAHAGWLAGWLCHCGCCALPALCVSVNYSQVRPLSAAWLGYAWLGRQR